jgi:flagellar hook-length control protein FliK
MIQQIGQMALEQPMAQKSGTADASGTQKTDSFYSVLFAASKGVASHKTSGRVSKEAGSGKGKKASPDDKSEKTDTANPVALQLQPNAAVCLQAENPGSVASRQGMAETSALAAGKAIAAAGNALQQSAAKANAVLTGNMQAEGHPIQQNEDLTAAVPQALAANSTVQQNTNSAGTAPQASAANSQVQQNTDLTGMAPQVSAANSQVQQNADLTGMAPQVSAANSQVQQNTDLTGTAPQAPAVRTGQADNVVQMPKKADANSQTGDAADKKPGFQMESGRGMVQAASTGNEGESASAASAVSKTQNIYGNFQNGKVVVKVSDVSAKAEVPAGKQVSNAVMQGIRTGRHQLDVNLYPQSLGKVAIKLTSENGMLTVEIAASNPKTQSILASSSDEIKAVLQSSCGQNVQVTQPKNGASQYTQHGQNNNSNSFGQNRGRQGGHQEKPRPKWYTADGTDAISTGDFLSLLKNTGRAL